jgi:hypothetical protein
MRTGFIEIQSNLEMALKPRRLTHAESETCLVKTRSITVASGVISIVVKVSEIIGT